VRMRIRGKAIVMMISLVVSLGGGVYAFATPLRHAVSGLRGPQTQAAKTPPRARRKKKPNHFRIVANPAAQGVGGFGPGDERPLSFTITNPYKFALRLTSITFHVTSGPSGCDLSWVRVTSPLSATNYVDIAKKATLALDGAHQPRISLQDLPTVDEDACKGGAFSYTFSASAVKRP